jgi:ABC-type transport system substrate-binding protein
VPPFDDINVRKAINMAIDRPTVASFYGGAAKPTQNALPPGFPGYEQIDAFKPDIEAAKQLVEEAGATGTKVKFWTLSDSTERRVGNYMVDLLNKIGFKASLATVAPSTYYGIVGNQDTKAQIGYRKFSIEYPHPHNIMLLFHGDRITPTRNLNIGNVDIEEVNAEMDRLVAEPELDAEVQAEWAQLDSDLVTKHFAIAPLVNPYALLTLGDRLDPECFYYDLTYGVDYGAFCERK